VPEALEYEQKLPMALFAKDGCALLLLSASNLDALRERAAFCSCWQLLRVNLIERSESMARAREAGGLLRRGPRCRLHPHLFPGPERLALNA
jgi:hypothetical protein